MTKYQQKIIDAMRAGAKLHFMTGMNAHWFLTVPIKPRPSGATVDAIKDLLVCEKSDWRGSVWGIKP